jgi:hypothetical protein
LRDELCSKHVEGFGVDTQASPHFRGS